MNPSTTYALGVDIGTSYTAAAVWRDGRASTVTLADRADSIPSAVFLKPDGGLLIGDAAVRRGVLEPDRLARGFKRALADPVPLLLGTETVTRTELTGQLLRFVLQKVMAREGGPPSAVTLTVPAEWGEHHRQLMTQVAAEAGLTGVGLLPEPVAVAIHYAAQQRFDVGAVIGVYDFGGGTFDTALVQRTPDGYELRGQPGGDANLGGEDFDDVVMNHVRRSLGNALSLLDMSDEATLSGLQQVRQNAIAAKESLSADVETSIAVILPGITKEVRLTRAEFQTAIRIPLLRTIDALERTVSSAGLRPNELHAVLLAGGSSQIPLVSELLSGELGVSVVTDAHPKYAVCLGAAITAAGRIEAAAAAAASLMAPPPAPVVIPEMVAGSMVGAPSEYAPVAVTDTEALVVAPAVIMVAAPREIGLETPADVAVVVAPRLRRNLRYLSDRDELAIEHHTDTRRAGKALLIALLAVAVVVAGVVFAATRGWFGGDDTPGTAVPSTTSMLVATASTTADVMAGSTLTAMSMPLTSAPGERSTGVTAVGATLIATGVQDDPIGAKVWRWDGTSWSALSGPTLPAGQVASLAAVAGAGPVVAVGWSADPTDAAAEDPSLRQGAIWVSADGQQFVQATVPETVDELTGVTMAADGSWLAVGMSYVPGSDSVPVVLTSPDGAIWTQVAATGLDSVGALDLRAPVADPAGGFAAVGSRMNGAMTRTTLWRSTDGVAWAPAEELPVVGPGSAGVSALIVDPTGALIAVGLQTGVSATPTPTVWRVESGSLVPHPIEGLDNADLLGAAYGSGGLVVVGRQNGEAAVAAAWTITGL